MATPIKVPRDVRLNHVVDLLDRTRGAHAVHLDFSDFRRADREAAMLLNCALVTMLDRAALTVTPPEKDLLERYGLMFGIANHDSSTEIVGAHASAAYDLLTQWRRPWTPGTRQQWLQLSADVVHGEPSVSGPDVAAFVNPHLVPRLSRTTRISHAVRPWLLHLLPPRARVTSSGVGLEFLEDLGRATDELVDNVGCHAIRPGESARSVRSGVFVLLARGNASAVRDRIYIAVVDSGPGILATARPKFASSARAPDDATLLRALFERHHLELGRARGFGLPDVLQTARRWRGGNVDCFTNGLHISFSKTAVEITEIGVMTAGSLVMLTVHTPPESRGRQSLDDD